MERLIKAPPLFLHKFLRISSAIAYTSLSLRKGMVQKGRDQSQMRLSVKAEDEPHIRPDC